MTSENDLPPSQVFLEAFRRHGAGISVVTLLKGDGAPAGFIATSLASLAANPPLLSFNVTQTASSWPFLMPDAPIIIHMLSSDDLELAQKIAGGSDQRFSGDHWTEGPNGLPILKSVETWLSAKIVSINEVDLSAMVAARVTGGFIGAPTKPLVYAHRGYHTLGPIKD